MHDKANCNCPIDYRNQLIKKAEGLRLQLYRPHEMKIRELEALVNNHYSQYK